MRIKTNPDLHRSLIINANYVDCIESKAISIGNHVFAIPKAHRHLITEYFLLFQRKRGYRRMID